MQAGETAACQATALRPGNHRARRLHGTRSAEAAALHIALGDRLSLDVAKVDCMPAQALAEPSPADNGAAAHHHHHHHAVLLPPPAGIPAHLPPSTLGLPPPHSASHLQGGSTPPPAGHGIPPAFAMQAPARGTSPSGSVRGGTPGPQGAGAGGAPPPPQWGDTAGGGGGGGGSAPASRLYLQTVVSGQELVRGGSSGNLSALLQGGGAGASALGGGAAGGHLHAGSLSSSGAVAADLQPGSAAAAATGKEGGVAVAGTEAGEGKGKGGAGAATASAGVGGGVSSRYFVCQAAYGFLGDVMHFSEGLRCLGPSRCVPRLLRQCRQRA